MWQDFRATHSMLTLRVIALRKIASAIYVWNHQLFLDVLFGRVNGNSMKFFAQFIAKDFEGTLS